MRNVVGLGVALLLSSAAFGQELQPMTAMPGYKRTSWAIEDGAPATISRIAQTSDGYLWLGSPYGLYRFDGVQFERLTHLERQNGAGVNYIEPTDSGDIWLGYGWGGVGLVRSGRLADSGWAGGGTIRDLLEAPNGDLFATVGARSFRFVGGRWAEFQRSDTATFRRMLAARDGSIWFLEAAALSVIRPGSTARIPVEGEVPSRGEITEDPMGRVLVAGDGQLQRVDWPVGGSPRLVPHISGLPEPVGNPFLTFTKDDALWLVGRDARSILRVPQLPAENSSPANLPGAALFEAPAGSANYRSKLFEDREGNIWVGTELGLERFRPVNVVHETAVTPGLKEAGATDNASYQVLTDGRGTVYLRLGDALFRMGPDGRPSRLPYSARPPGRDDGVCVSGRGGLWVRNSTDQYVLVDGPAPQTVDMPPNPTDGPTTATCIEDGKGRLWLSVGPVGVFRWDGREFRQFAIDKRPGATAVYMGLDSQGRVLTYYGYGSLMRMEESGPTMLWRFEDLSIGFVNTVLAAPNYMLIAGESGIARHDHRGFRTLSGADYPFLREVSGFVQTETGHTWLISRSGIVRLSTRELEARFDDPRAPLNFRIFDNEDGLTDTADVPGWDMARQGPDGRLWFSTNNGIYSLDPSRLRRNEMPPPVVIRSVVANGVRHEFSPSLNLGSGVRNLQIDFTAPSLSRPSHVQFRYRLTGVDEDWVDPGTRRQAIYTNLSPGEYQFQVMAANEDGVWNREAAALEFSVPPTFTQSRLFLVLCIAAAGLLLWLLYKLRLRQVAGRIRERLEARQRERERIARELHDTLLQSVQGLILKVQAASEDIPEEAPARAQIERALDEADQVLLEGRDRVRGLRATEHAGGLAEAMSEAAERLVGGSPAIWTLTEEGTARALKPMAAQEISRIAEEALFNAHRHAEAKQINLTISYGPKALIVAIKDDGNGIDPEVLAKGERTGHFGLPGMRERAERLGGGLQVDSAPGAGTRIEVSIPASAAYVDHGKGSRSRRKLESEDA